MDDRPPQPALLHFEQETSLFTQLSQFQARACALDPVAPRLPAVLAAALPAFEAGFSYTSSHWRGELTVTLHWQGAELGSSCAAAVTNYSEAAARLLAGLLGIPLAEDASASEAEAEVCPAPVARDLQLVPEPEPTDANDDTAAAAEQPQRDAIHRPLTDAEKEAAIGMIKVMPPDIRKAFTKTFRQEFDVPPDAKQVAPFITELRHWQFIDRFTVEAAGGIAA